MPASRANPASGDPCFRILVAEDNDINARLMKTVLGTRGHQVTVVENGQNAVEAVQTGEYDVIVMDMQMPVMDGAEATRAIRALPGKPASLPIIALTADVVQGQDRKYRDIGLTAFLTKPVDWGQLCDCLARHVDGEAEPGNAAAGQGWELLDEAFLTDLIEALPQDKVAPILDSFLDTCPQLLHSLRERAEAGDHRGAARAAHSLAGQALGFGANLLGQTARQYEQTLLNEQQVDLDQITDIHDRTLACISARKAGIS